MNNLLGHLRSTEYEFYRYIKNDIKTKPYLKV